MKEQGKLKILGVLGSNNFKGSKLHRIQLPLGELNGQELEINGENVKIEVDFYREGEQLFADKLERADILYFNWLLGINPGILGAMLTKYSTKMILDYDDVIFLPKNHDNYLKNDVKKHLSQIMLADGVVVATPRLGQMMKGLKKPDGDFFPVLINHNHLPNKGQWEYKPKEKREGKIAIGIFGSRSHKNDWLLLRGMIKILGNNKKFAEKCKFVITGYGKDPYMEDVWSMFKGIKAEVEWVNSVPYDNYMSVLDKIDILLAPLEESEMNLAKSELKLLECAIKDIPVVASPYYLNKGMSCCIVENPEDWQKWIWALINEDKYFELGKQLGAENRAIANWDKRIQDLKLMLKYVAEKQYTPVENLKIWGITYNNTQYTEFEPYFNQTFEKSWRFEYNPIIDIVSNKLDNFEGYVGIFSWKFNAKTGLSKKMIEQLIAESNEDVINLSPNYFKDRYLKFSYEQHPGLEPLLKKVCNKMGLEVPKEVDKVVYSNFFLAKADIYKKYVNEIIIPSLNYMENEIWEEVNIDAQYKSGLSKEKLKEYTGLEYYNFVTFICERLLSTWLWNNKQISFKQIG